MRCARRRRWRARSSRSDRRWTGPPESTGRRSRASPRRAMLAVGRRLGRGGRNEAGDLELIDCVENKSGVFMARSK
eukprot:1667760-Pyramimonas_sp.AAC.1